jgi:predicted MFS family arabinose efflux permease
MKNPLFTKEFIILNIASFLAQINMAVFFQLHQYLASLGFEAKSAGLLIGIFSLAGVFIQPVLSPFITTRNARKTLVVGVCATICALIAYRWATTFPLMLIVRILHGVGFVFFATAMNAVFVPHIPVTKSGQAFGLISLNMLLPMATIPALLGWLHIGPESFVTVLMVTAVLMIPTAILPLVVGGSAKSPEDDGSHASHGLWRNLVNDFSDVRIPILILTNLLNIIAYTPVFYLFKEFAEGKGITNAGMFFTVATGSMMAVRIFAGNIFDRLRKPPMLVGTLCLVAVAYALMVFTSPGTYLLFAVIVGIGWSLFMPFLHAILFECSKPAFRALNLNLSQVMLQAGYFIGPIIGTSVLHHSGYSAVFLFCGFVMFVAAVINTIFAKSYGRREEC